MIDRERLRKQLAVHEDRRAFVYDDCTGRSISEGTFVRGNVTVGVGRNLVAKGLSDDEIDYLLDNDINDAIAEAQTFRWFASLDPVRAAVVVELCFNMGVAKLRGFKLFLSAMAQQRWPSAADEIDRSKWQEQVDPILGDGKGRADALIHMIRHGEYPP